MFPMCSGIRIKGNRHSLGLGDIFIDGLEIVGQSGQEDLTTSSISANNHV
jgi:hypothetical protein